ncbi:20 kDa translocon at the inner membrane of chloroplasts [Haematococcus lacustris]
MAALLPGRQLNSASSSSRQRRSAVNVCAHLQRSSNVLGLPKACVKPAHSLQSRGRSRLTVRASSSRADDDDEVKKDWKFGRNEGPMPWPWKLMCAILYMLPWVDVTEKTVFFIERFPAFVWTEYFTEPFEHWFYIHEYAPLIIFFATYLGIVRNKKIPHVARYHIMMGVMLDIIAMIMIVVEENLPFGVLWTPWADLFYALMFWLIFLVLAYCLFFCFMGWYCEIPLVSEGVYMQIEQAEQMGGGR